MNKLYLTPSETRRYAVEMPVGDPYSGPAFGKKTMPVAAVALAASSFVAGATAFAAATTTMGMIAAGATMVGSALSIIGTVTGNSKLAKIGGILAIGGMAGTGIINSMAETAAQGAAQAATDVAVSAGGEAINSAAHFSDAAFEAGLPSAASAAPGAAEAVSSSGGLINMAPEAAARPMTDIQSQAVADAARGAQAPAQGVAQVDPASPFQAGSQNALDAGATEVGQSTQMNAYDPEMARLVRQDAATNGSLINTNLPSVSTQDGYFDRFGRWVKENPQMAKIGAEFAGGLFPSQRDRAITEAYRQRAADERRRALWATGRTQ